jgi:hypothetical protein
LGFGENRNSEYVLENGESRIQSCDRRSGADIFVCTLASGSHGAPCILEEARSATGLVRIWRQEYKLMFAGSIETGPVAQVARAHP